MLLLLLAHAVAFDATSPACTGETMQFDSTVAGATAWQWTVDGVDAGHLDHVRWAFEEAGAHRVELVATTPDGDVAEALDVEVHTTPQLTLGGPILVEAHQQVEYTAQVVGEFEALHWVIEGGTLLGPDGEEQATVEWGEAETGEVTVQVDNGTPCVGEEDLDVEISLPSDGEDTDTGDGAATGCACATGSAPTLATGALVLASAALARRQR